MNDHSKDQVSIVDNINKTEKIMFGDETSLLWPDIIDHVVLELDACLGTLRDQEHRMSLCKVSDTLGILQSCCQKLETLIQIEIDAHRLRNLVRDDS